MILAPLWAVFSVFVTSVLWNSPRDDCKTTATQLGKLPGKSRARDSASHVGPVGTSAAAWGHGTPDFRPWTVTHPFQKALPHMYTTSNSNKGRRASQLVALVAVNTAVLAFLDIRSTSTLQLERDRRYTGPIYTFSRAARMQLGTPPSLLSLLESEPPYCPSIRGTHQNHYRFCICRRK